MTECRGAPDASIAVFLPPGANAAAIAEAMRDITGPIIAIRLAVLSVFAPVACPPGSGGALFRLAPVTSSAATLPPGAFLTRSV